MATTVEHALRRTTMHLPDRPQTVEPHAMHGRHHHTHQQRPPFTPTSSSGTPTNPLPLAWSASRSRTPAINIPYSRTRTNSHSAGSGGTGTPDSGTGGGSGTPPSLAMLRDRRMSRHASSTASGGGGSGDKDELASSSVGSGSWKERIYKATRDRFRDMKADAERDLRERLGHASGFESAKAMREEHKLAMENLRQAMAEEEVELIRREEESLKRNSKRLPRRRDVVIEDDFEDDEVLWEGDGEGLSREERLKAAVLEEQHVLWDAIKRTGGGSGGGGASGIRSTASTTTNASIGSSRRRDSDGYASDFTAVRDTNPRSSRLRWTNSPSSSKALPSTPPTQPGAANPSSASASASAVDMTMHQRWIPSVSEYAADMREKEKEAAAKAKISPPAKEMRAGTSPSSGSWRDWSIPDHVRTHAASRRAPTPTPGTGQSPPVRSQTPAVPMRAQTPSPTTLKRPIPMPMPIPMAGARAQTPAPAPMQRAHSPVVMAKRSQTPGPGHVRQGSHGANANANASSAPRMHHRTASESHGGAGGLFQQELENMAARLRRELAIPSA